MRRIIIEGNIGSGKSTVLTALQHAFPEWLVQYEPVEEWTEELALFYESPSQWSLPFSLRILLSHHRSGAEANAREAGETVIVERCPLSCRHVFTQLLFNDGTMPQHHWDLFREYYDLLAWEPSASRGDVIIYLETPVDQCMDRIQRRARPGEEGIDIHYLRRLEFLYSTMLRYTPCCVKRVDGSKRPEDVVASIVDIIQKLPPPPPTS